MIHLYWQGHPVSNPRAWAEARGEALVYVELTREVPDALTGILRIERIRGKVPESFRQTMALANGWS